MRGFEYKQVDFSGLSLAKRQNILVGLGVSGWELVAIDVTGLIWQKTTATFKRPL